MKRIFIIIVLSLIINTMKAQNGNENKFSFATTIGTGISMNAPSSTPFTWQALGYYNLSGRWSVGAGTGLSFYEKMLIPLYADVRYQIGRTRKFTPYTELGIGYSFALSENANGGFFINPSIGIQYPLRNKMKLQFAIGYELQELERLKKQTDNYFHKEFTEQLSHNMISFKLGLFF